MSNLLSFNNIIKTLYLTALAKDKYEVGVNESKDLDHSEQYYRDRIIGLFEKKKKQAY